MFVLYHTVRFLLFVNLETTSTNQDCGCIIDVSEGHYVLHSCIIFSFVAFSLLL